MNIHSHTHSNQKHTTFLSFVILDFLRNFLQFEKFQESCDSEVNPEPTSSINADSGPKKKTRFSIIEKRSRGNRV